MWLVSIIREDSKYNKYIKWFARGLSEETGSKFSFGYRTQKEAKQSVDRDGYKIIEVKTLTEHWKDPRY